MRLSGILLGLVLLSAPANAAILHVPADYPTISAAIAAASSGDEIRVAPGTYHEKLTLDATKDGVKIHSESGPAITIIDADHTGTVVTMASVGSGTELIGFTITNGAGSSGNNGGGMTLSGASAKIQGNVIRGNSTLGNGGGVCVRASSSPTILANEIANNQAQGSGGGIMVFTSNPDIENNNIHDNQAPQRGGGVEYAGSAGVFAGNQVVANTANNGGGLYALSSSSPLIQSCLFQSNTTTLGAGGGIFLDTGSTSSVLSCRFIGNSGGSGAGGIYAIQASPVIRQNWVQDNTSPHGSGGGIYIDVGSNATVDQNVIVRNRAVAWGGGFVGWGCIADVSSNTLALNEGDLGGGNLYARDGATLTLERDIVTRSSGSGVDNDPINGLNTINTSCNDVSNNAAGNYQGMADPTGANGNISADPLFCDLLALDVHLASTSPCTAANSPAGCGLVGALDIGCDGPVRTEPTTWGAMKARYR